jgi:hypothetical protein
VRRRRGEEVEMWAGKKFSPPPLPYRHTTITAHVTFLVESLSHAHFQP